MKKYILGFLVGMIVFVGTSVAFADPIKLPNGTPFEALQTAIDEIWVAIANIELTPGPTGPQGEKGDKGDIGEQGPQGPRGEDATSTVVQPKTIVLFDGVQGFLADEATLGTLISATFDGIGYEDNIIFFAESTVETARLDIFFDGSPDGINWFTFSHISPQLKNGETASVSLQTLRAPFYRARIANSEPIAQYTLKAYITP